MRSLLSPAEYYEPEVFALERVRIFERTWQLAGLLSDVAKDGDFLCVDLGGKSVVVQNFAGALKAFRNVCSHRHNQIRRVEKGNGPLRCEYHGWTYGAQGEPVVIPSRQSFSDLSNEDLAGLRLKPWSVETFGPLVFVNETESAPTIRASHGQLADDFEAMLSAAEVLIDRNEFLSGANWKVTIENGLEGYHVALVHPETIRRHGVRETSTTYAGPSSLSRFQAETGSRALGAFKIAFPDRPASDHGYVHSVLFPNVVLASIYGAIVIVNRVQPLGPLESRFTSFVFSLRASEREAASAAAADIVRRSNVSFIRQTYVEDNDICESVQRGLTEARGSAVLGSDEKRIAAFQQGYRLLMDGE